jgi:hypothetical protein
LTSNDTARWPLEDREGRPTFREQWHAEAVAIVEVLVSAGAISPDDWSRTLGAERERHSMRGGPDSEAAYYEACLSALESILARNGLAPRADIDRRRNDWHDAYLSTPHGQPVMLRK